jgi:PAS domain S-box-containing protein
VQYAGTDLATVVDTVGQPLWVIDPNGRVRLVNAAAVAALGYDDASELYGAPSHETIHYKHPDGSPFPAAECPHLAARVTGRPFRSELDWFVRRDGSMLPVAVVCTPLELPDGTGVVMAFTDIEERRRHEAELLERDQILAAVIQPVWVATHEGLLHYCNPAAVRVLGYDSADELLGLPAHAKVHYKRRDGSPYPVEECPVTAARLRGETIEVVEDHWIRKDGSFVLVSYSAAPIELAGGTGAVVAFTDVDERRRAEQAMRERDVAEARAAELAAARRRIIEAHDAARRRVTRDLHDGAQQQLVNTVINLQLARRRLDEDPERARELMDEALERAQAGIVELREPRAPARGRGTCRRPPAARRRERRPGGAGSRRDRGEPVLLRLRGADQRRQARRGDVGARPPGRAGPGPGRGGRRRRNRRRDARPPGHGAAWPGGPRSRARRDVRDRERSGRRHDAARAGAAQPLR